MRKKIADSVKKIVKDRQKNRCCCCLEYGKEYHHLNPVASQGNNSPMNVVLLCEEHHQKVHLGDLDTIKQILEYCFFINYGNLPKTEDDLDKINLEIKTNNKV